MIQRRTLVTAATLAAATLAALAPSTALSQARRPWARLVVGFPPGGTADVIGRALAEQLRGRYATNVIVENKPGALGAVAIQTVNAAEPDGGVIYIAPHPSSRCTPTCTGRFPTIRSPT